MSPLPEAGLTADAGPAQQWMPFPGLAPATVSASSAYLASVTDPNPGPDEGPADPFPAAPQPRMAPYAKTAPGGLAVPDPESAPDFGSGDFPALPRRTRQASLAPQLREASHPTRRLSSPPASSGDADAARSAEHARSLISSVQQGWRSGRAAAEQADDQTCDGPADPAADGQPGPGGSRS
jgi:hypothetical protein